MKRITPRLVAAAALGLLLALGAPAAESLSLLLQKGIYAEETERNLDAAIRIYEQITAEGAANRALAAQAQYRLAVCHQKKGNKEQAIAALNELLKQIPADAALASKARETWRLLGAVPLDAVTIRKVPVPAAFLHSVSRDGRFIAHNPKGSNDLAVYETATGKTWIVFRGSNAVYVQSALFSPDNQQIAYTHSNSVYLARIDGSDPKLVYHNPELRQASPWVTNWSPLSEQLFVGYWQSKTYSMGILDINAGTIRELRSKPLYPPFNFKPHLSFSGRYLAYQAGAAKNRRQILLIDLESGGETTVVEREVEDIVGWAPDDAKVLFTSDRTGVMGLWATTIRNGRALGEPELIKANFGKPAAVGVTSDGKVYYAERQPTDAVHLASVDFATGEVMNQPRRATERFPGLQSVPIWSSDGQRLMIAIQRGGHFVSVPISSGDEVDYPAGTTFGNSPFQRIAWSQAGGFLLVRSLAAATGKSGIHRFDLGSRKTETLVVTETGKTWDCHPRLSADGHVFYYTRREFTSRDADNQSDWKDVIIRRDLRDHQEEVVYTAAEKLQIWWPFDLSPDGSRLAIVTSSRLFRSDDEDYVVTIKEVALQGGETREVLRMPPRVNVACAAWTPDGKRIVYLSDPSASAGKPKPPAEIWSVDLDSGQLVKVNLSLPGLREFALHPDGRQMAIQTTSGVNYETWVMEGLAGKLGLSNVNAAKN